MDEKQMRDEPSEPQALVIVRGYHLVTPVPREVITLGLLDRVALIMSSDNPGGDDWCFDYKTFVQSIVAVARHIEHDAVAIEFDDGSVVRSPGELMDIYRGIADEDHEPPIVIRLTLGSDTVCLGVTECWALCGGPPPYHDSYTLSFYTLPYKSPLVYMALSGLARDTLGVQFTTIDAGARPLDRSI